MTLSKISITSLLFFLSISASIAQNPENKKGYNETQVTSGDYNNSYASYSKLNDRILFESNRDGHWQIYAMDSIGAQPKKLVVSSANDRRPSWHPLKNMIVFESDRSGSSELYILNLETEEFGRVPINLNGNKSYAQFAPNGEQLVFSGTGRRGHTNIYTVSTKGKRLKRVVSNKADNLYPHFSHKGDIVAFSTNKNEQGDGQIIYTHNIITKKRSRLTLFKNNSYMPTWSHNRTRIAYITSLDDTESEVFIMRRNASNKTRITYNSYKDEFPNWSSDDLNLLVTRFENGFNQIYNIHLNQPFDKTSGPLSIIRD